MTGSGGFWWRWLAATAVLFGAAWVLLTVLDTGPRPGRLLLLVALVTAALALVNVGLVSDGPDWSVQTAAPLAPAGQDTRLGMYTRVISGHLDARLPDSALRDRLAELADLRLHQRHGSGLHDPSAETLLGADVNAVLTGPVRRLSRDEIERCVRRIEEL
jgi:hypothetical protein